MKQRLDGLFPLLAFVCLLNITDSCSGQESQPGLVATYRDGVATIVQVVPTPHFMLDSRESIHPQIGREFSAEWRGLLKIDRAAEYRFTGAADLRIRDQPVGDQGLRLSADEHPIVIRFQRQPGDARQQIRWSSDHFAEEPIPSSAFIHREVIAELANQDQVEHGRYLFGELGCANCHPAANWKLNSRRGPDLSRVGSRVTDGWLFEWLRDPRHYRESAVMPVSLRSDSERADVTAFLMSLVPAESRPNASARADSQPHQAGPNLFEQVGCSKCHDKQNNLDSVGAKYVSASALADFIANPHAVDPHGRMPQLFDPATEGHLIRSVAEGLFHGGSNPMPYAEPPQGDPDRGHTLFASRGCASCHSLNESASRIEEALSGPAFGRSPGLPLRHLWSFEHEVNDAVAANHGKVNGQTAFAAGVNSDTSAFAFDGTSYIELAHFARPDSMTISAWVKTSQGGSILTWGRAAGGQRGSREWRMNIGQDGANSLCYGEYNSDGGWRPVVVRPANVNLVDDQWHHIALVRDGEQVQHFVDGKPQGRPGRTHAGGGDYTDRLIIGALGLSQNPSNRFRGLIDDLSVWDMALSPEQVEALATGRSPVEMASPPDEAIRPYDVAAGCLAQTVADPLPDYHLSDDDRSALRQFLQTTQPQEGREYQIAPLTLHDLRIRQYRCTACHELNSMNVQAAVEVDDDGRFVRVERPPLLTGAGNKLTASWLRQVLRERQRNRPWLNLKMPHFGDGIHDLPELITKASGSRLEDTSPRPDKQLAAAGIEMIGERRGQVSCIACHNYRGINRQKDGVVPAPDLAQTATTIRRDWFKRWMHNPSRLQPGTSMPQLFLDVSDEERELRIEQLWSALSYQAQLPLPNGLLDKQTEGTRIVVRDEPVIFRMATVTPVGQIDRAINVGLPGGLNYTFDAAGCRLRYAWRGAFIDAGPAWNGRGGNPVRAGDEAILKLTAPHAVRIGTSTSPPVLRFKGFRLESNHPVFRYEVDGASVELRVTVASDRVTQRFSVTAADQDVFYAGGTDASFTVQGGQRTGDRVRFAPADRVEFEVVFPIAE